MNFCHEFLGGLCFRQGQFLNVRGEKTSEKTFYEALTASAKQWPDVKIRDYCCVDGALAAPHMRKIVAHSNRLSSFAEYLVCAVHCVFWEIHLYDPCAQ